MMEQITLEQFRRTVRIRLRLLRVFILLCAAAVFCAHFGATGAVCRALGFLIMPTCSPARFPRWASPPLYLHPPYKNAS